jgi:hypothetical protein
MATIVEDSFHSRRGGAADAKLLWYYKERKALVRRKR